MKEIIKKNCPQSKLRIKCPFSMTPSRIVIHNTANDASAVNEIAYMHSNGKEVSFHFAVDDCQIVQGIELDRNAWHAGDGNGKGNREGIAIEICYSRSGGERFLKAQENAAELAAFLLKKYGWGLERVTKHQDYNGKHCPHRTLDEYGWMNFLKLVEAKLSAESDHAKPSQNTQIKTVDQLAKEVMAGKWGNGNERKQKLTAQGYDYAAVQAKVNALAGKADAKNSTPATKATRKKTSEQIAKEVIAGKWGNGTERKQKLTAAGYDYKTIQSLVNKMVK